MIKKLLFHPLPYIFLLALFLRTYQLNRLPYGFHVDEVKVGWNAYSLLKTGRDDWWHAFPLHYDTFGDQRPTGIMYASVPAIAFLGLNVFAVRFTSALFGALGVIAVFYLANGLFKFENIKPTRPAGGFKIGNFASLLLAFSPWHIALSRATSEGVIAVTLVLFGLVLLLKKRPNHFYSAALLISAYFFYHTARILVPVFVFAVVGFQIWADPGHKLNISKIVLFLLTLILTLTFALSPIARSRLNQVSIFSDLGIRDELDRLPFEEGQNQVLIARIFHNKVVLYSTRFANEYFSYFSPKFFLSFGEAKPLRYATVLRGPLLYIEFLLLIIGLGLIAKKINLKSSLLLLLLLLSPLPAALTTEDAPNLHRALFILPFISIIAGLGLYQLRQLRRPIFYLSLLLLLLDFTYYSHLYLVHNPARDTLTITRNAGVDDLFSTLDRVSGQYRQIILTNRPDPLFTWYAFYHQLSPFSFNQLLALNKDRDFTYSGVTFSQFRCPSQIVAEKALNDTLAVDTEGCNPVPNTELVAQIKRFSGGIPYTLSKYQPPRPTSPRP